MTNLVWKRINFANGDVIGDVLPVSAGGGVSITVTGEGSGELSINISGLPEEQRGAWRTVFAPIRSGIVLEDTDLPWNDPSAVLFAGFINKLSGDVGKGLVRVQVVEALEYMKRRKVADVWGRVTDPTTTRTFTAGTWAGVMLNVILACFSSAGIPSAAPKPPQILKSVSPAGGVGKAKTIKLTDMKSYFDVLEEIKNSDSGNGQEFLLKPNFASSARNRLEWEVLFGDPHIRGSLPDIVLPLEESSGARFSSYGSVIDSRAFFSKLWMQSKRGDEELGEGADLDSAYIPASQSPILVESFFNPQVELNELEFSTQMGSRIALGNRDEYTVAFSVEEHWNPSLWLNRLGRMIQTTGIPATISEGHTARLRMIGLSFTVGKGTVKIDVIQPQVTYPALPKPKLLVSNPYDNKYTQPNLNPTFAGGAGGSQPWNPGDEDGGDGGPTIDWGSGGSNPGDIPPTWNDPLASEWTIDQINEGVTMSGIHRICTNEGNTVFGVGYAAQYIDYGGGGMSHNGPHIFPMTTSIFGVDVFSGYLMNGLTTNMANRGAVGLSQAVLTALWGQGGEHGIGRPTEVWAGTPTTPIIWQAFCESSGLRIGDIFSISGNIFIAIELNVSWRWKRSTATTATSWSSGTPPRVDQAAVVFLKATYESYDSLGAFYVDPESGFSLDRPTTGTVSCIRAGSWVVMSSSGNSSTPYQVTSSNFISGGEAFGTWWNFPNAPVGGATATMGLANNKSGENLSLFLSLSRQSNADQQVIYSHDTSGPPIPAPEVSWELLDTTAIPPIGSGTTITTSTAVVPHKGNTFILNSMANPTLPGRCFILDENNKIIAIPPYFSGTMPIYSTKTTSYGDYVYHWGASSPTNQVTMTSFRLRKIA